MNGKRRAIGAPVGALLNADGSIDVSFGPTKPAGAGNWIETVPGKGFFPMMRFYSPTEAYFDKSWMLPEVQKES